MKNLFLLLFRLLTFIGVSLLFSCQSSDTKNNCPIGTPTPMFSGDIKGITGYNFEVKGQESQESFVYKKSALKILQSGCEYISQSFHFDVESGKSPQALVDHVVYQFIDFAQMGKQQAGFLSWSQVIDEKKSEIKLGEAFSPAPGIEIALDRIQQVENDLLILRLEMKQN